ncbi:multiple epidermal growth factor-like domains protein 11 [Saccostrea echinata]|uniref:multiple epidermal growth factor-like domains protein 11 n=1 Tax=Saccostrea echinata TaxID=191078 RepID=UPI002A81975E|nr:multiple epidermal growth factor-like domains protein 11 [Saccostrea echinata]
MEFCDQTVSRIFPLVRSGFTEVTSSSIHLWKFSLNSILWPGYSIDGDTDNTNYQKCSITALNQKEAWLRVDLKEVYSLHSVKIWYRQENPETILQETCKEISQYVWIYNNQSNDSDGVILEVCEIQIYGCPTGTFGTNCSQNCSHCKNTLTCDVETGACDNDGCAREGFEGSLCKGCPTGTFGTNCSQNCSHCKNTLTCDVETGACDNDGCAREGFEGSLCKACKPGQYGENCSLKCGNCNYNDTCDRITGQCETCAPGWKKTKNCDQECDSGYFGPQCTNSCKINCNENICDPVDGRCLEGCRPGWQAPHCNETCPDDRYGRNCEYSCSRYCYNATVCDKQTGHCPEGCIEGYQAPTCKQYVSRSGFDKTSLGVGFGAGSLVAVLLIVVICIPICLWHRLKRKRKRDLNAKYEKPQEFMQSPQEISQGSKPMAVKQISHYYTKKTEEEVSIAS